MKSNVLACVVKPPYAWFTDNKNVDRASVIHASKSQASDLLAPGYWVLIIFLILYLIFLFQFLMSHSSDVVNTASLYSSKKHTGQVPLPMPLSCVSLMYKLLILNFLIFILLMTKVVGDKNLLS